MSCNNCCLILFITVLIVILYIYYIIKKKAEKYKKKKIEESWSLDKTEKKKKKLSTKQLELLKINYKLKLKKSIANKPEPKKIGATTILNQFIIKEGFWRRKSTNGETIIDLTMKTKNGDFSPPGKLSRVHDSINQTIEMFDQLGLKLISREQHLYYNKSAVLDIDNNKRTLHGIVDTLCINDRGKICIVDIKTTSNDNKGYNIEQLLIKQRYELQMRIYALLVYNTLNLNYVPNIYLFCIRPDTSEAIVWEFKMNIRDLNSIEKVINIYPETYNKISQIKF